MSRRVLPRLISQHPLIGAACSRVAALLLVLGLFVVDSAAQNPPPPGPHPTQTSRQRKKKVKEEKPATEGTPVAAITGKTADELLSQGFVAYQAGSYADAIPAFSSFLILYGKDQEAMGLLNRVRPLLALSYIRLSKFADALPLIREELASGKTAPGAVEDLVFFQGVCEMSEEEYPAARKSLEAYAEKFPKSDKIGETVILAAKSWVLEEKWPDAATFCRTQMERPGLLAVDRGQLAVLALYATLSADDLDAARKIIIAESPRLDGILQIVAFQTLALECGARYLEAEKWREAISCLQRIWSKDRLLKHQDTRLDQQRQLLDAATQRRDSQFSIYKHEAIIRKIESEITNFQKIENWDSSLRLRLATAFQGMERYREAALVLEDMLERMPPDPIVESASVNLIRCWMQVENWPRAVDASVAFQQKFPKSDKLPLAIFYQGDSEQRAQRLDDAIATFRRLVQLYPASEFAARGRFMEGFTHLLKEDYAPGIEVFEKFPAEYPKEADLTASSLYWKGMGYSLAKQHQKALELMDEYLKKYPTGQYASEADFRRGFCIHCMKQYPKGIAAFDAFLKRHPQDKRRNEALILQGDAYLALGQSVKGIETFRQVSPDEVRFFEEAWFKTGRAYRLMEETANLRTHMEEFPKRLPQSPRVAEAVYWIGWSWLQENKPEKAREIYWNTLRDLGDTPSAASVEDLITGLAKLYPGEAGKRQLADELDRLGQASLAAGKKTLALRCIWGQATVLAKISPDKSASLLAAAAKLVNVEETSPRVLTDIADSLRANHDSQAARKMYEDALKWNPNAVQRDRIFAGLGILAEQRGAGDEALGYYVRFVQETAGSVDLADILLRKAGLEVAASKFTEAEKTLNDLLASKQIRGVAKADALCRLGDLKMTQGDFKQAVAYYQRVYVLYGRWSDLVAKSYLRSGEAFERLGDTQAAVNSYREIVQRDELKTLPEAGPAQEKLTKLEAVK